MGRAFEFRKERKMKRWAKMSKVFTRLGKDIVIAVKEGGPDPDTNSKLRAVIQNAKSENMPKDNIERAIKRATSKDQEDYKEVIFEGYAPHGIAILIETATDNNTRTVANVRSHFNKCNGSLSTSGSVDFMFERKCFFRIAKGENDLEELELELIDYGADEIFEEDDSIMIYAPFTDFGGLQKAIEEMGLELMNSGFERIPMDTKKLSEEEEAEVDKLLERLEEDDDVQNVFHNMA
ncbi:YebC/PmpR family DNA-binding transcriptional regulator [Cryomorphaceae bacterium 1068]|nr:YebC/PmpR family DNA-binding transcriptional regulator [Cryomorphaceae bacterium 1068]